MTISQFTHTVGLVVQTCGRPRTRGASRLPLGDPDVIYFRNLERILKFQGRGPERTALVKSVFRARRTVQRKRATNALTKAIDLNRAPPGDPGEAQDQ